MAEGNEFIDNALTLLGDLSASEVTPATITQDKKINELLRQLTELMAARESASEPAPESATPDPEPEISLEEYGKEDEENSENEMTQPTQELRQDHLESSNEAFGTKSRDKSRQAKEDRKAHLKSSKKAFGTKSRDKSRKSKGGFVDPQGGEPLITTDAGRTIDEIGAPERGLGDYAADAMAESAEPEDYTDKAIEIFKDLHGGEFDPKSRMDRGKLEKMKSMLADVGGIGDDKASVNKFALQFYRNS